MIFRAKAAGTAAVVAAGVIALSGCSEPEVEETVLEPGGLTPDDDVVFRDPEAFDGVDVTLEGEVFERLGSSAFALQPPPEAPGQPLLVVFEGSGAGEGTPVAVTGTVRKSLDIAAVESDLGVDLDDALLASNVGRPYLLATQVERAP